MEKQCSVCGFDRHPCRTHVYFCIECGDSGYMCQTCGTVCCSFCIYDLWTDEALQRKSARLCEKCHNTASKGSVRSAAMPKITYTVPPETSPGAGPRTHIVIVFDKFGAQWYREETILPLVAAKVHGEHFNDKLFGTFFNGKRFLLLVVKPTDDGSQYEWKIVRLYKESGKARFSVRILFYSDGEPVGADVQFSPTGTRIAIGHRDGTIDVYETDDYECWNLAFSTKNDDGLSVFRLQWPSNRYLFVLEGKAGHTTPANKIVVYDIESFVRPAPRVEIQCPVGAPRYMYLSPGAGFLAALLEKGDPLSSGHRAWIGMAKVDITSKAAIRDIKVLPLASTESNAAYTHGAWNEKDQLFAAVCETACKVIYATTVSFFETRAGREYECGKAIHLGRVAEGAEKEGHVEWEGNELWVNGNKGFSILSEEPAIAPKRARKE